METLLYSILSPLCSGRVFPDHASYDTERPFITYQQVGGDLIRPLNKSIPNMQNALVQVNVWNVSPVSAKELALQVEDAIRTSELFSGQPASGMVAFYEEGLDIYGVRQDFSIWYSR